RACRRGRRCLGSSPRGLFISIRRDSYQSLYGVGLHPHHERIGRNRNRIDLGGIAQKLRKSHLCRSAKDILEDGYFYPSIIPWSTDIRSIGYRQIRCRQIFLRLGFPDWRTDLRGYCDRSFIQTLACFRTITRRTETIARRRYLSMETPWRTPLVEP